MTRPATGTQALGDVAPGGGAHRDFVTLMVAGQWFGIPVLAVQDVLGPQRITRIPLASREVAGSLNLRGRIVTAIDIRQRLGFAPREDAQAAWSVVVDNGIVYSLVTLAPLWHKRGASRSTSASRSITSALANIGPISGASCRNGTKPR